MIKRSHRKIEEEQFATKGAANTTPSSPEKDIIKASLTATHLVLIKVKAATDCCKNPALHIIGKATRGDIPSENKTN